MRRCLGSIAPLSPRSPGWLLLKPTTAASAQGTLGPWRMPAAVPGPSHLICHRLTNRTNQACTAKRDANETWPAFNRTVIAKVPRLASTKADEAGLAARYVETPCPTPPAARGLSHAMRHRLSNGTLAPCTAKRDANETPRAVSRTVIAKVASRLPPKPTKPASPRGMSRRPGLRRRPPEGCPTRCGIVSQTGPSRRVPRNETPMRRHGPSAVLLSPRSPGRLPPKPTKPASPRGMSRRPGLLRRSTTAVPQNAAPSLKLDMRAVYRETRRQ